MDLYRLILQCVISVLHERRGTDMKKTEQTHERGHIHGHVHADGQMHQHSNTHSHSHNPEDVKAIVNRLAKACGHLEAVKRMVEDGRDCSEVLIQLAAVKAAINNAGKELLKEHISHCIVEAVEANDSQAIEELNNAIDKFIK